MALPDILILGMANTPADYLDQVQAEVEGIRTALAKARRQNYYEPRELSQFTFRKLLEEFNDLNQSRRITMLHYAGHSHATGLLAREGGQDKLLHADKLRAFLAAQNNLRFVFLNSCYSEAIAGQLADAGVPVVVGTDSAVEDTTSLKIATVFYETLGGSSKTIREAFEITKAYYEEYLAGEDKLAGGFDLSSGEYPWHLFCREEKAAEWRLVPRGIRDELERLGPLDRRVLFVFGKDDNARQYYATLKTSLAGLPNTHFFGIWDAEEEKEAERASILQQVNAVIYLSTPSLEEALNDELAWLKDKLDNKKRSVLIGCEGKVLDIRDRLIQLGLMEAGSHAILPSETLKLGDFPTQLLDSFIKDFVRKPLEELIGVEDFEKFLSKSFTVLNFNDQKKKLAFDKGRPYNFILIEGTEDCAQELLVRYILREKLNIPSNVEKLIVSLSLLKDKPLTEKRFWSVLLHEVGRDVYIEDEKEFCEELHKKLQSQDVVLIINDIVGKDTDGLKKVARDFWKKLNDHLPEEKPHGRLLIVMVNKGYSEDVGCCISELALEDGKACFNPLVLPLIAPVKEREFSDWHEQQKIHFPPDSPFRKLVEKKKEITDQKYMKPVMGKVCELLNCNLPHDVFEIF